MRIVLGALLCWAGWHARRRYLAVGGLRERCQRCQRIWTVRGVDVR